MITTTLALALVAGSVPAYAASGTSPAEQAEPKKLKEYVPVARALPGIGGAHDNRYVTTTTFWSVVAVDPDGVADIDLSLWDNAKHTKPLAESEQAAGLVDFVAVDGNHRAADKLFPEVLHYSGTGQYTVQLAQGSDSILGVRDALLVAGTKYRVTLTSCNGTMRGALYLMDNLPLTVATWVKPNSAAMKSAFAPLGQPVVLEVTSPRTDWYGLVITTEAGAGSFELKLEVI